MAEVFSWWLAVEALGLIGLPLTALVCRNLPDRGWALTKPLSLLLVGWLIWFPLTLISALPYSRAWIVGTVIVYTIANALLLRSSEVRGALVRLVRQARGYLLLSEGIFAGAFALMAWVRSFTPGVVDTEKFMDEAFLAAIIRTPHLPPPDPWLAGYSINYYYFGHYLLATLAKLVGTTPAVAFNVGIALVFALIAVTVFGVAANLWAAFRGLSTHALSRAAGAGLLSALAVLIFGNFAAVQVWWQTATALTHGAHAVLANPFAWWLHPQLWVQQDWWATWWSPSRAVPNTITEFPAFSFLLADLHAHVLALPFAALAVGLGLNLVLARGEGIRAFGERVGGRVLALIATGIALGSLYAINGWDLPTYLGLVLLALAVQQWLAHDRRITSVTVLDLFIVAALLVIVCLLAFLPFYRGFSSPAQGIGLVPGSARTPIGNLFSMFGLAIFLVLSLLAWRLLTGARRLAGVAGTLLVGGGLSVFVLLTLLDPGFSGWTEVWGVLVVLACAALALGVLGVRLREGRVVVVETGWSSAAVDDRCRARAWLFVLIGTAAALVVACEIVYLRDVFSGTDLLRMNTVFKLYYQAWLLLGVATGPVLCWLLAGVRDAWSALVGPLVATGRARRAVSTPVPLPVSTSPSAETASIRFSPSSPSAWAAASAALGAGLTRPRDTSGAEAGNESDLASVSSLSSLSSLSALSAFERNAEPAPREQTTHDATAAGAHSPGWAGALRACGAGGIVIWMGALILALLGALVYPVLATAARTDGFALPRSLDGTAYMATDMTNAGDAPAIAWLNAHVAGEAVIVEAAKYDEYTHYGRISAFTGLPTLVGWGGHEVQWRLAWLANPANANVIQRRITDVQTIYTSGDTAQVMALLRSYHVSYIYVGAAERQLYGDNALSSVRASLRVVYARDGVTIYATPWA